MPQATRIILVSGLSGAGKSVVLHALEDLGYYCVDNLPASMLEPFVGHALRAGDNEAYQHLAIGIDARDSDIGVSNIGDTIGQLRRSGLRCELLAVRGNPHFRAPADHEVHRAAEGGSVTTATDERAALAQSSEEQGWRRRAIDDRVDVYSRGAIRIRLIGQGSSKLSGASIFVDEWYDNYTRDLGTVRAWLKR
jgi:UPF0042 nucleotide-binding protein